jgi:hypothetical protein
MQTRTERNERLQTVKKAILEGKAYLDTAFGEKTVEGYNDETGWALTGKGFYTKSFMVTLEAILIR